MFTTMLHRGATAVRRRSGLILGLYGAQLLFTLLFMFAAGQILSAQFAHRPLFARGVRGDDEALFLAIQGQPQVVGSLLWLGLGFALLYGLVWAALGGGVWATLAEPPAPTRGDGARRFGAQALAHLPGFVRLWLWSLLLWLPTLIVLGVGLALGTRDLGNAAEVAPVIRRVILSAAPGLVAAAITSTAVDLARWRLVGQPGLASRRALWAGLKLSLRRPQILAWSALYVAAWLLVSGLYVLASGPAFAGAAGALGLFVIRQVVAIVRVALRVGLVAGQQVALE
jgi:hypothetical protein